MARTKNLEDSAYKRGRRDDILAAAAGLFSKQGFAVTTVREIGDVVGMNSGSLYYYFPSKEAIADALLRRYLDYVWERYDAVSSDGSLGAGERLVKVLEISVLSIDEYYNEVILFQRDGRQLARDAGLDYVTERRRKFRDLIIGLVKDGIATGDLRSNLDVHLTYNFIRDTIWSVASWYKPGSGTTIQAVSDSYLPLVLAGIVQRPIESSSGK